MGLFDGPPPSAGKPLTREEVAAKFNVPEDDRLVMPKDFGQANMQAAPQLLMAPVNQFPDQSPQPGDVPVDLFAGPPPSEGGMFDGPPPGLFDGPPPEPSADRVIRSGLRTGTTSILKGIASLADALPQPQGEGMEAPTERDPALFNKAVESILPSGNGEDLSGQMTKADPSVLTPEEEHGLSFGKKVLHGAAGMVPALPAVIAGGMIGAPVAAGVMGFQSAMGAGMGMIDQGASLKDAMISAQIGNVAGVAQAAIPMVGSTIAKSVGLGAASNPLIGMVDDAANKLILSGIGDEQAQRIAKNIDPFDLEKRGVEGVLGGFMGAGFHGIGKLAEGVREGARDIVMKKHMEEIIKSGAWAEDVSNAVSGTTERLVGDRQVLVYPKDKPIKDVLEEMLPVSGEYIPVSHVVDMLAQGHDVDPDIKMIAQMFQRRIIDTGLDEATIWRAATEHPDPNKSKARGMYDPKADIVTLLKGNADPRVIMHEIEHAMTSKVALKWEENKLNPNPNLSEPMKRAFKAMDGIDSIYQLAMKKAGHTNIEGMDYTHENYGYKNIREFITEAFQRKEFQTQLHNMKLTPTEVQALQVKGTKTFSSIWSALLNKIHQLVAGSPDADRNKAVPSMLDAALGHITNLIDVNSAEAMGRTKRAAELDAKSKAFRSEMTDQAQFAVFYQISNLLRNASGKGEFLTRLAVMDASPAWREYVKNYGEKLWNNGTHIINAVGKDTSYAKLTDTQKLIASNEQQIPDFFDQLRKEFPPGKEKLDKSQDIEDSGTAWMPSTQLTMMKGMKTLGGQILKMIVNKSAQIHALGVKVRAEAQAYFVEYQKLSKADQKTFMQMAAHWDDPQTGGATLKKMGLQWPNEEMLTSRGMTPEQAHAYGEVTKGLDYLWTLQNQLLIKNGQDPIPQIPGYMPHVWKGPFKVRVLLNETKPNSTPNQYVVRVRSFQTAWGAKNFMKAIENSETARLPDGTVQSLTIENGTFTVTPPHEVTSHMIEDIHERVAETHALESATPELTLMLEKAEKERYQGFVKHNLERDGVRGYIGDPTEVMRHGETEHLVNLYDEYAKNVAEAYKNSIFMAEVGRPTLDHMPMQLEGGNYYGSMLDNTHFLQKYLREFTANWTGQNINHFKPIDDYIGKMSLAAGLSPYVFRQTLTNLKNFMSILYLRASPIFALSNVIQPMHTIWMIETINGMRAVNGETNIQSTMKTLSKFFDNIPHPDPEMKAALDWAKHNHILDAQLEYAMRKENIGNFKDFKSVLHTLTGGTVNPAVERNSRQLSFMLAYEHARSMFPGDVQRARTAAQQTMEMTMVNYDKSSKPLAFTNYGSAGEIASPFATFRMAYMGNMYMTLKLAAANPGKLSAWLPAAYMMSIFGAIAGGIGLPFADDIDRLITTTNEVFSTNLPGVKEYLFKSGLPDWAIFGMLSTGSKYVPGLSEGVHIGPSVGAVAMDSSLTSAMLPFVASLYSIGKVAAQGLAHEAFPDRVDPIGAEDIYKAGNMVVPGVLKPLWQKFFTQEGYTTLPKGNSLTGGVEETDVGRRTQWVLGRQSLDTAKNKAIEQNVAIQSAFEKKAVTKAVKVAADVNMNLYTQQTYDWALAQAAKYRIPQEEFQQMVAREILARHQSAAQADTTQDTPQAQRRRDDRYSQGWNYRQ